MKKFAVSVMMIIVMLVISCASVDVESQKIKEAREMGRGMGSGVRVNYVTAEEVDDRERQIRENDLNIFVEHDEIFIPVDSGTRKPLSQDEVVRASMREAMVTPQNFIGGTQYYDYNENKQYPVVTKVLGLTVIQLEDGEVPIGVPFMSDTLRWELTGDIWRTQDGRQIQLVMIKPLETGLITNMVIVTNRRVYQIILTSTRDSYMPMVRFRYPGVWVGNWAQNFKTMETVIREEGGSSYLEGGDGAYLSYNYKIKNMILFKKPEWFPTEAWDDGHKTYIKLPRGVLQMEYPVVFEENTYIVNYRVQENLMILDKLVKKATLRLGGARVQVIKQKGEARDIRRYVKQDVEVVGDRPPLQNGVQFIIEGNVPWIPEKVIEYDGEIYIFFKDNVFNEESVLYIIGPDRNQMEYRQMGNIVITKVVRQMQLAYNNQLLTIRRR